MHENVATANFNVTFGKSDEPLLNYFEEIVYPAFTSGIVREHHTSDSSIDKYFFLDVKVVSDENEDFILTGKIVKETILEIKSKYEDNRLVKTNEKYPAAPYSVFYVYLRNHRMILIKNQKGSPDIKSFGVTARHIINQYVRGVNQERRNENKTRPQDEKIGYLPYSNINVVGIPMREELDAVLTKVEKMLWLKLRMYPLNGDIDYTGLSDALRGKVGSKTASITLNSPKSKEGVVNLINESQGIFEATLNVQYKNGATEKITNNTLSGKTSWNLSEDEINDVQKVIPMMENLDAINNVSKENQSIYDRFKSVIKKFIN